jgi:hypothetical protein
MVQIKDNVKYAAAMDRLHNGIASHQDGQESPVASLTWEQVHADNIEAVLRQTYIDRKFWRDEPTLKGKEVPDWMPLHAVFGPNGLFCYFPGNERVTEKVETLVRLLNNNVSLFPKYEDENRRKEMIG